MGEVGLIRLCGLQMKSANVVGKSIIKFLIINNFFKIVSWIIWKRD
jgi:hypothetical protein